MIACLAACEGTDDGSHGHGHGHGLTIARQMQARDDTLERLKTAIADGDEINARILWSAACRDSPTADFAAIFRPSCAKLAMAMECEEMAFFDRPVDTIPAECRSLASGVKPGASMLSLNPYAK